MNISASDAEQSEICPLHLSLNCQSMHDLLSEVLPLNRTSFPHCDNVFALKESALSGCPLCIVFLHLLHGCDLENVRKNATKAIIDELPSIPVEVQRGHISIDVDVVYDWHLSISPRILRLLENQMPDKLDLMRCSVRVVPSS
jgi:hypothetical protein